MSLQLHISEYSDYEAHAEAFANANRIPECDLCGIELPDHNSSHRCMTEEEYALKERDDIADMCEAHNSTWMDSYSMGRY